MTDHADVVVIGAGPAGATAAALLAAWGHRVVAIHGDSDGPSLAESLPASIRKLFRFLGQLDAVDAAAFHPNHGNVSRWAEMDAVASTTAAGYHVRRSSFDAVLREHARGQGATVLSGYVRRVEPSSPVVVECVGAEGTRTCRGRFVLDCSGRAGVVARRGLRRADSRYRTLAVAAEWQTDAWPEPERTQTVVDSYDHGWAWSIPLSMARRQCTVMIDADRTTVRKSALEHLYAEELRRARTISARLADAARIGPVWACDASTYDSLSAFEQDALLVGDAASSIDVLSSGGVKKAVASAWSAAVVVHTCLTKPSMRSAAAAFHNRRERQVHAEYTRRSAAFYAGAAQVYADPFWSVRAVATEPDDNPSDFNLSTDPEVQRAFARLRDARELRLAFDPQLTFADVGVIEGREVVLREGIAIPGIMTPIRFAAGLNLPALVRMTPHCRDVAALLTTYEHNVAPVDPRGLLTALAFLITRRVLVHERPES